MSVIATREQPFRLTGPLAAGPRRPAPPTAGGGFTGRDFLRLLRKRKWLILLCLVSFTATAVLGTLLWSLYAPWYTAAAFLEVRGPQGRLLGGGARVVFPKDYMERRIRDYAGLVKTDAVLSEVIKNKKVQETDWYKKRAGRSEEELIRELDEAISVGQRTTSNLIHISMTSAAKTKDERSGLAVIVNELANVFIKNVGGTAGAKRENRMKQLGNEQSDLETKLRRVNADLESSRSSEYHVVSERSNALGIKIQVLQRESIRLQMEKSEADATVKSIESAKTSNNPFSIPGVKMQVDNDPLIRQLRATEVNLSAELENVTAKFGPEHRTVKTIRTRLASIRTQTRQQMDQAAWSVAASIEGMYKGEAERLGGQVELLLRESEEANTSLREMEQMLADVERYTAKADNLQKKIDMIGEALLQERLVHREESPVVPHQQATSPRLPSWPKWQVLIPLGVILGLLVGLGLAFVLEFMDTSIKGPSDLARRTDLPMLGMVPHSDDMEEEIEDLRLAFMTDPNSLICEAFRQIRTSLLYSGPAEQRRSLLVTSALPEDGRGTVAMNLAAAMARAGKNVLVIDANFRQPMIHKLFPQCPEGGLSSALVGQARWKDQVCPIETNLSVMSSGPLPPNPAELLGSEAMKQVISEAGAEYDQVIFDGAPCLLVTDGAILSTMVDGVIMVVRAGANTYGVVQRMREMLHRVGARILGVVLNGIRVTAGGYLRENYDAFYDYQLLGQDQTQEAVGSSEDSDNS